MLRMDMTTSRNTTVRTVHGNRLRVRHLDAVLLQEALDFHAERLCHLAVSRHVKHDPIAPLLALLFIPHHAFLEEVREVDAGSIDGVTSGLLPTRKLVSLRPAVDDLTIKFRPINNE